MQGEHPLRRPADLRHHVLLHDNSTYSDVSNPDWGMWLEHAGVSDVDVTRGPSFWPSHLVIAAAVDGLGVALVKKNWVMKDLADGLLVRPFDVTLPVEFSYFMVYPQDRAADARIAAFVSWVHEERAKDEAAAQSL